MSSYFDRGR